MNISVLICNINLNFFLSCKSDFPLFFHAFVSILLILPVSCQSSRYIIIFKVHFISNFLPNKIYFLNNKKRKFKLMQFAFYLFKSEQLELLHWNRIHTFISFSICSNIYECYGMFNVHTHDIE